MTPKQRVLKHYPRAYSERTGPEPVFQIVTMLPYGRAQILGSSVHGVRVAWERAARSVEESLVAIPAPDAWPFPRVTK